MLRSTRRRIDPRERLKVIPVKFSEFLKEMLGNTKLLIEQGYLMIDSRFEKLITSLHTALERD